MSISAESIVSCVLTETGANHLNEFIETGRLSKRFETGGHLEVEFWVLNYLFNDYFFNDKAESPIEDNLIIDHQHITIASLIEDGVLKKIE